MDYIIYFIITILILVFIHEFGHFAAAKICRMRVDIFAIGFGKRLFGWNKKTGFTFGNLPKDFDGEGNTDYRLSALPLGGYVKIAGMVDESFDTKFKDTEPQPNEFRAKPTYQKLFVITAGVMMNLTLAVAIFAGINFFQGKQVIKTTEVGPVAEGSPAYEAGFKAGDKILNVNGQKVENWDEVIDQLLIKNFGSDMKVEIERDNKDEILNVSGSLVAESSTKSFFLPFGYVQPFVLDVMKNSPAEDAGLQPGDAFLALNNTPVKNSGDVIKIISAHKQVDIPALLLRGNDTVNAEVTPGMEGKIGITISDRYTGPIEYRSFGFFDSFSQSVNNIGQYTMLTFSMVKNVIAGKAELGNTFGGPVKIAKMSAQYADQGIIAFLSFLAILSLSLAILNIMPFPVLDGGHFVIILIEGIIKKELPIKIKIAIQNTGFVLLMLLMIFIIYNDIINL